MQILALQCWELEENSQVEYTIVGSPYMKKSKQNNINFSEYYKSFPRHLKKSNKNIGSIRLYNLKKTMLLPYFEFFRKKFQHLKK